LGGAATLLLLVACADSVGPRPRPGALSDTARSSAGALLWYALEPRVITLGSTDSVRLTARINGTNARILTRAGETYSLQRNGSLHSVVLPVSTLLFDYRAGDLHHIGAQLEIEGQEARINMGLNIRDAAVPAVTARGVAPGAQATDRILNLRVDTADIGRIVPTSLIRDLYRHFSDAYDFIAVIEAVRSTRSRTYQGVSNEITGLGLADFDNTTAFGSAGALQGIIQYPNDEFFDLAETGNIHEIGHRWIHFTDVPQLASGSPHWPLSSLAYGIMGLGDARNSQGSEFPYQITEIQSGYRLDVVSRATEFNDFELYLMGLLPAEQVRPYIVFANQALVAQARNGAVLPGPIDTVRVTDIIAREGPRSPAAGSAPRSFRIATIVLSRGRLLTASELAFYDHMAARGEAETILPYTSGLARGNTRPFFLATSQRARLLTRLNPN
jgi:hypothetical protein